MVLHVKLDTLHLPQAILTPIRKTEALRGNMSLKAWTNDYYLLVYYNQHRTNATPWFIVLFCLTLSSTLCCSKNSEALKVNTCRRL